MTLELQASSQKTNNPGNERKDIPRDHGTMEGDIWMLGTMMYWLVLGKDRDGHKHPELQRIKDKRLRNTIADCVEEDCRDRISSRELVDHLWDVRKAERNVASSRAPEAHDDEYLKKVCAHMRHETS